MLEEDIETVEDSVDFIVGTLPNTRVSVEGWDTEKLYKRVFDTFFMRDHTLRYRSIDSFMEDSPAEMGDVKSLESDEFQEFVRKETSFDSWEKMRRYGVVEFVKGQSNV